MSRVTSGVTTHKRHKKIIDQAKGYYGRRKNTFKVATQAVDKANQYATRDRHNRKRNFRSLYYRARIIEPWDSLESATFRSFDSMPSNTNASSALLER